MAGSGNAKPQVGLGDEDLRRSEFFRLPWVSKPEFVRNCFDLTPDLKRQVREAIGIHEGLRGLRVPDGATR